MRVVIDTNVLLSGLLRHGTPHMLMENLRAGSLTLVSSPALINELAGIVHREKFRSLFARSNLKPEQMLEEVRLLAEIVHPPPILEPVRGDPDDDAVLVLAVAAQADLIVSGDGDLLVLRSYAGIPIVTPAQALARL